MLLLCAVGFLYCYAKFVCNRQKMVIFSPICALKMHSSYRTHYIIFRAAGAKFYIHRFASSTNTRNNGRQEAKNFLYASQ